VFEQNGILHKPNAGVTRRAAFRASDLNAKLDLGDEPEECHGLTTSATREKALSHRNGKKTANEQSACRRSPWKRQNKHCKTPEKGNAVCLFMGFK